MGGQHQDEGSGNGQEWVSYMDVIRDDLIGEYNTHLKTFGDHKRAMGKTVASGLDGSDESPLLMTAVQTDLVESFLEDVLCKLWRNTEKELYDSEVYFTQADTTILSKILQHFQH